MIKDIISKLIFIILFIIIGVVIGFIIKKDSDINIPKDIYIRDSLKIDSLILEINNLEMINNSLKDSIKFNDSVVIIKKEEIKKLPLTDKVLFLKKKLEDYEEIY